VGKGLTFDTGGISIKPSAGMEEMKFDMCGGANVIGAILAIARLKLKVNVTALVASTENMPGPSATKPGDVHVARNGKSFEINNTDAEGRLILADALSYATELKPAAILDAATLTGAMVIALGNIHTGFFTRSEALSKKINAGANLSGELVWRMPLVDHHVKDMKGTYADLSNTSSTKGAGSATAAAFLEQFVGEGIPWAHFDIAGTGWSTGNRLNYNSKKGASGVMVRTFVEIARSY
jgi:leucyl aminopeptidase